MLDSLRYSSLSPASKLQIVCQRDLCISQIWDINPSRIRRLRRKCTYFKKKVRRDSFVPAISLMDARKNFANNAYVPPEYTL